LISLRSGFFDPHRAASIRQSKAQFKCEPATSPKRYGAF
jgi:hypothetical protein